VAADAQRLAERQARRAAAVAQAELSRMPPALQYWYAQGGATAPASGPADGGGEGGAAQHAQQAQPSVQQQGAAPAASQALWRYVPGVGFVPAVAQPVSMAYAVPPPAPMALPMASAPAWHAGPAMPVAQYAPQPALGGGGADGDGLTDEVARAVRSGLRAGGAALADMASRVRAVGHGNRGYAPVGPASPYDAAEPQPPAYAVRQAGVMVVAGQAPSMGGQQQQQQPQQQPQAQQHTPGSAASYGY
jgi:hypothetical protein